MNKKHRYKIIAITFFILFAFFLLVNRRNVFAEGIIKEKNVLQEEVNDIEDLSQLIKKVFIHHDYENNFYYQALDSYSHKNYLIIKDTFFNQLDENFTKYYRVDEENGEIIHKYLIKFTLNLDDIPNPSRLLNDSFLFLDIHKELFFLSGNNRIKVTQTEFSKYEISISFGIINDYTNDNFKTLKEDLKYFYTNFNHLTSTVSHLNDYEKALYFHDWLVYHNDYNENAIIENPKKFDSIISHAPISALKHEYSPVCEGYSELYYLFLTATGVRNIYITGKVFSNGKDEDHAWNYVFLNDKYYLVDTTWDDPSLSEPKKEFVSYKYFLIGSEESKNRIPDEYYPFTGDPKEKKTKISYPNLSVENFETFIEDYSIAKHFENPFPYLVKEFDGTPIDPFENFSYKNDYNIKIINANTGETLDKLPKEIGYYIFILTPKDKKYYQRSHLSFYTQITNFQVIPNISKDIYIINGKSANYTDKIALESNKKLPNISKNSTLNELITLIKNSDINTDFIGYKLLTIAINGTFYEKSHFNVKLKDIFPNIDSETIFNINLIYEENYVKLTLPKEIDIISPEGIDTNNIPINQEIKLKINNPKNTKLDKFLINGDPILLSGDEYTFKITKDTTITALFEDIYQIIIKDENGNNYPLDMYIDNPKSSDFLSHIPNTKEKDIIIGYKIGDSFITKDTIISNYSDIVIIKTDLKDLIKDGKNIIFKDNKLFIKKENITNDDFKLKDGFTLLNITKDDKNITLEIKSDNLSKTQLITIPYELGPFSLTLSGNIKVISPSDIDLDNVYPNQEIKIKIIIPENKSLKEFLVNDVEQKDKVVNNEYTFKITENTIITALFEDIYQIIIKDEKGDNYPLDMNTDNPKSSDFLNYIPKTKEGDIIIGYKIGDNFITKDTQIESYDNIIITTINTDKLFISNDNLEYKDNKIIIKKDGLLTPNDILLNENFTIENVIKNEDNTLTFQIKSKHLNNSQTLTLPFSEVRRPIKKDNNNKLIIIGVLGAIGFILIITVFAVISKSRKRK